MTSRDTAIATLAVYLTNAERVTFASVAQMEGNSTRAGRDAKGFFALRAVFGVTAYIEADVAMERIKEVLK